LTNLQCSASESERSELYKLGGWPDPLAPDALTDGRTATVMNDEAIHHGTSTTTSPLFLQLERKQRELQTGSPTRDAKQSKA
jgi:hypothetical protein